MRKQKPICALDDIADGDSAAVEAKIERKRTQLIAVRRGGSEATEGPAGGTHARGAQVVMTSVEVCTWHP